MLTEQQYLLIQSLLKKRNLDINLFKTETTACFEALAALIFLLILLLTY